MAAPPAEDEPDGEELRTVRPYAVTGGRTAPTAAELPLEGLVQAVGTPAVGMTRESRSILELTAAGWLSVAELSAHVRLPVPVVRVVIGDLQRAGAVRVHAPEAGGWAPTSPRSLLESVLDGISSL